MKKLLISLFPKLTLWLGWWKKPTLNELLTKAPEEDSDPDGGGPYHRHPKYPPGSENPWN